MKGKNSMSGGDLARLAAIFIVCYVVAQVVVLFLLQGD